MLFVLFILITYLIKSIESVNLFRLSTQFGQIQIMHVNDSIVSTLGYYKATLLPNICTLTI